MKYLLLSIYFSSVLSISYSQNDLFTAVVTNNKESISKQSDTKDDNKKSAFHGAFNTTYSIIRSTTGYGGSSKTIHTDKGNYTVSQSIGQSGAIGTHYKNNYVLLQGYQQNSISFIAFSTDQENILKATVYPNPFGQSINILFEDIITNDIFINVYDVNGKEVVSTRLPASDRVTLLLNKISNGPYILKVIEGDKQFIGTILKQ